MNDDTFYRRRPRLSIACAVSLTSVSFRLHSKHPIVGPHLGARAKTGFSIEACTGSSGNSRRPCSGLASLWAGRASCYLRNREV